ncbi:NAD(P)-dependent oxidoreductase [Paraburkholderia nemoris]|uniref:NAD(P)-dependent oxidoreductase n=1 Tax=Paraburkholderia nemoris TaxID=2793076 RepID=UPI0038B91C3B
MAETKQLPVAKIGWMGIGRMGYAMARRLGEAGADIAVYNRSADKAKPLEEYGAKLASGVCDLASCDIVFTMLSTGDVVKASLFGPGGLVQPGQPKPKLVVDCSSISLEVSAEVRLLCAEHGINFLAAPISGNPHVVEEGLASFVVSGEQDNFESVRPFLLAIGKAASYVGDGELARVAKICHNVWLGALTQSLAEVVVLAQKAGMTRAAFMDFLNGSALGSTYTRVKTPHWVALDFSATFTPALMRKDMDLGIHLAQELGATLPLATITRDLLQSLINRGIVDEDFSALLLQQAEASGLKMTSE